MPNDATKTICQLEYRRRPEAQHWVKYTTYPTRTEAVAAMKRANARDKKYGVSPRDWRIKIIETTTTIEYITDI